MDKRVFITGTDTDVGKTFVTSCLIRGLAQLSGESWGYVKPVQTGPSREDADFVQRFAKNEKTTQWLHYSLPASPDQAAEKEGKDLQLGYLLDKVKTVEEPVFLEGAGGLLVPLNQTGETWFDFLEQTDLGNLVLVARSSLGTLNHTLLTLRTLEQLGKLPGLVVLNGDVHADNLSSLRRAYPSLIFTSFEKIDAKATDDQIDLACKDLAKTFLSAFEKESAQAVSDESPTFAALQKLAKDYVWFPFTQHKGMQDPILIEKAEGVYLIDQKGKKYIDGISSWWVNNIGHGRPEIGETLVKQQQKLDHVIFTGAIHENAVALASELAELCSEVPRTFYSDNGSTSVEVAMKMAIQYWQLAGQPEKNKILHIKGGYHGDTFGAMSVSATSNFHKPFEPFLIPSPSISPASTHKSRFNVGGEIGFKDAMRELKDNLELHGSSLAAIILEPMLQGAGGMVVQQQLWLDELNRLAKAKGILLIYDEVFTGIGRVGDIFAYKRLKHSPDMVCCSKGITGGTLPLGVTLASEAIFQMFLSDQKSSALLHGHSYTGNPISTGVARTVLQIAKRENLFDRAVELEGEFTNWLEQKQSTGAIKNSRVYGGVMAFELQSAKEGDYFSNASTDYIAACKEQGLFLRPLGGTIYFAPPLSITAAQLNESLEIMGSNLS